MIEVLLFWLSLKFQEDVTRALLSHKLINIFKMFSCYSWAQANRTAWPLQNIINWDGTDNMPKVVKNVREHWFFVPWLRYLLMKAYWQANKNTMCHESAIGYPFEQNCESVLSILKGIEGFLSIISQELYEWKLDPHWLGKDV